MIAKPQTVIESFQSLQQESNQVTTVLPTAILEQHSKDEELNKLIGKTLIHKEALIGEFE